VEHRLPPRRFFWGKYDPGVLGVVPRETQRHAAAFFVGQKNKLLRGRIFHVKQWSAE
jgi:hypothetical protein